MYRFKAIILNITKIRDNNTRIVMISSEYWKITGWWNKKNITGIDLWDIVEVLISRESSRNTIKGVDLLTSWWNKDWDYSKILSFLEILKPYHYSIFQMRILKSLGTMDPEIIWDDAILRYIYQHISHTPLERILWSSNIKNNHITKIQQINFHSIYMLEK